MTWDTQIPIGQELVMQFQGEDNRFRSAYFGCKPDSFLIVQMPGIPGIREKVVAGGNLVVRYMSRGMVYGFYAYPLNHVLRPCPLIFLSFPQTIEKVNLRKTERVETFIEAKAIYEDNIMEGLIIDLSEGGCGYTASRTSGLSWPAIEPGNILMLDFILGHEQERHVVETDVVTFRKEIDSLHLGLRFRYTQESPAREAVKRYVATLAQFLKHGANT